MMTPFDIAKTPLNPGVTLIEASAGTGKTYTITGIFLRLILEESLPVKEILAVTFTVAATAELRDRIRRRLREALEDLRRGESEDPIVAGFLLRGEEAREAGIRQLDYAVQNFDQASILTIHSFCQKVLHNNAFESGLLFDMELLADPGALFEEVARDYWRIHFYQADPLLSRLALAKAIAPQRWVDLLQKTRNHPSLRILSHAGPRSLEQLADALRDAFDLIGKEWKAGKEAVMELLRYHKGLSRDKRKGFDLDSCERHILNIEQLCAQIEEADPDCLRVIECLSTTRILGAKKGKGEAPEHVFFEACERFHRLSTEWEAKLGADFLEFSRRELPQRKARQNVFSFDDLLNLLSRALAGSDLLATQLRGQFKAALIDEFQDTDPVQYGIFKRIFADGEGASGHRLFFIGDPKQAIYGFRGADIFTYLEAAKAAQFKYTLETNFRSEPGLLEAVNHVFGNANPFLFDSIEYRDVRAPEQPRTQPLSGASEPEPLQCRFLPCEEPKGHSQGAAEDFLFEAVVADICRLMAGNARIGTRPVAYGDLAILVRSNAQAETMLEGLREKGIKGVLQTDASVFGSPEATALQRLLDGVLEPARPAALKTALSTVFFGLNAADLAHCDQEEAHHQGWLERFLGYRKEWEEHCFMALFRRILVECAVRERLVQSPGGERKLTNLLHLAELIHQAETGQKLGAESVAAWLRAQRQEARGGEEQSQLRLESDQDAVVISTIHKSKGLEYPIVFCPFLWKPANGKGAPLFHDPQSGELTLDCRDDEQTPGHRQIADQENLAESLRLAYVALTRAKNRCYLYAGAIQRFELSPLAHLLGEPAALEGLRKLAERCPGTVNFTEIDKDAAACAPILPDQAEAPLHARTFSGRIPTTRVMASFTGLLSAKAQPGVEEPRQDPAPAEPTLPAIPAFSAEADPETAREIACPLAEFPKGASAGLFFHELLENLDFQNPDFLAPLARDTLARHGFSPEQWLEPVCGNVRALLKLPLVVRGGLRLEKVANADRRAEVEFSHRLARITPGSLAELFARHAGANLPSEFPDRLGRLQFSPVEGTMRGFIDLLFQFEGRFYIVDWKSNWLGQSFADYDPQAIQASMLDHSYYLQYHLYTLATDLFLSQRLPGYDYQEHFGGVFYLFLRGIDPQNPGRGLFQDRPAPGLVAAMRELMIGGCL